MHLVQKMLLTTALLLYASSSIAQEPYHSFESDVMARLSYDNSGVVQHGNVRHVCIAVSRDREYRIVRSFDDGQSQRLQGQMLAEGFRQLSKLLGSTEFRDLEGDHGGPGLILQEAESFAAEIPLGDRSRLDHEAWRLHWLNGDGENPFPASVSKLVDWLQRFQPKDGKSFDYIEFPDVCPAGGLRLLQPSVAEKSRP